MLSRSRCNEWCRRRQTPADAGLHSWSLTSHLTADISQTRGAARARPAVSSSTTGGARPAISMHQHAGCSPKWKQQALRGKSSSITISSRYRAVPNGPRIARAEVYGAGGVYGPRVEGEMIVQSSCEHGLYGFPKAMKYNLSRFDRSGRRTVDIGHHKTSYRTSLRDFKRYVA